MNQPASLSSGSSLRRPRSAHPLRSMRNPPQRCHHSQSGLPRGWNSRSPAYPDSASRVQARCRLPRSMPRPLPSPTPHCSPAPDATAASRSHHTPAYPPPCCPGPAERHPRPENNCSASVSQCSCWSSSASRCKPNVRHSTQPSPRPAPAKPDCANWPAGSPCRHPRAGSPSSAHSYSPEARSARSRCCAHRARCSAPPEPRPNRCARNRPYCRHIPLARDAPPPQNRHSSRSTVPDCSRPA